MILTTKTVNFSRSNEPESGKLLILPIFVCLAHEFLVILNSYAFLPKLLWTSFKTLATELVGLDGQND